MADRDFEAEILTAIDQVRDLCDLVEEANDNPGSDDQGSAAMDCVEAAQALEHLVDEAYAAQEGK